MSKLRFSDYDREIIVLAAVWDMIGSMVHYGHFEPGHRLEEAAPWFVNQETSRLFIIFLADFLSAPPEGAFGLKRRPGTGSSATTFLGNLADIAQTPNFQGDTTLLGSSTLAFSKWLDGSVTVENVWLSSIDREGPLTVGRLEYLKICGTISKHGFTRLGNVVSQIQTILKANGTVIDQGQAYQVIPEFQEWFRDHVFVASASLIAYFLNEIRWGLYDYLRSEFQRAYRSHRVGDFETYRFDVPIKITTPLIRTMYWDLMNGVRSPPQFPRFTPQPELLKRF